MLAAGLLGFALRVCRRWVFFAGRLPLHEAMALEGLFQGAILLNPQLRYPDVECELLAGRTGATAYRVYPWFRVRTASAVILPIVLAGLVAAAAGRLALAAALALAALAWTMLRAHWTLSDTRERARTLAALALGAAAAVGEGLAFAQAVRLLLPETPWWAGLSMHAVLLTALELSPLPLALGVLESVWLVLSVGTPIAIPMAAVQGYRAARALIVLPLLALYLPRYKMSMADLFDPRLALALSRTRRRDIARPRRAVASPEGPALSVVIPAYNEAERLPRYVPDVVAFARSLPGGAEIIVVDDGSRDGTADYVRSVAASAPEVRLCQLRPNRGKGAAVQCGVLAAAGRYVLFADADGATPIAECAKLLRAAERGADVVIASRRAAGDGARRERSWLRRAVGSTFYRVTNLLAVPGILDTQCGFKLFTRDAARRLFTDLRETGWAFDVALLFRAQKLGMTIEEVPVSWTAVAGSKVRPRDALAMLVALLRIRRRDAGLTREPALLDPPDADLIADLRAQPAARTPASRLAP